MLTAEFALEPTLLAELQQAVHDVRPVAGLTHQFYRYPARFSPAFARAAIKIFTHPGDLVVDPFVGGGTTLVEALIQGRSAVGADISELARFVSKVKTTPLNRTELEQLRSWTNNTVGLLNLWTYPRSVWLEDVRADNLIGPDTWRIKRIVALALEQASSLKAPRERDFARCLILKTAQWALDGRKRVPPVADFRRMLLVNFDAMRSGIEEFSRAAAKVKSSHRGSNRLESICLGTPAAELHGHAIWTNLPRPKLILTSPPYPGVHVLYHRWQVRGRRETPAPFWITNSLDGHGPSYYTFGHRTNERHYFAAAVESFRSLAHLCGPETLMVQLVGFSDPDRQLPLYLDTLEIAGFAEVQLLAAARLWRQVPNRKWHADIRGASATSREVVLVHRRRPTPN